MLALTQTFKHRNYLQNANSYYIKLPLYPLNRRLATVNAKLTNSNSGLVITPTQNSTVERGTAFEERSQNLLRMLSMSLRRVGGKGDNGIDLLGWWWLPQPARKQVLTNSIAVGKFSPGPQHNLDVSAGSQSFQTTIDARGTQRSRIRVIVQCKAEKRKLAPRYIRELGGVVHGHITSSRSPTERAKEDENETTVGILVSESPFTSAALKTALTVPLPLLLLYLPPLTAHASGEERSTFEAAFWNTALDRSVLSGRADLRWEISTSTEEPYSKTEKSMLSLWHGGMRLDEWIPASERMQ